MRRSLVLLILLFLCVLSLRPACAQQGFVAPVHAHFVASVSPAPRPGKVVTITVTAALDPGWHLYSLKPISDGPFPTSLTQVGPGWRPVGKAIESAVVVEHDPNFGLTVGYHLGSAEFQQQFRVTNTVAKPTMAVHFQTCTGTECLPPQQTTVPLKPSLLPPPSVAAFAASPSAGVGNPSPNSQVSQTPNADPLRDLGLFLLAAFGAGLLTLLTPCVFPMIPITLTSFIKQADGDRRKLVAIAFAFALGIVVLYVGLGVAVTALVGVIGLSRLGANPWVNLLIFALFVVFAMSFFDTIQLSLPVNLGALQSAGRRHGGTVGLALLGIAFVLASFTCVAPFVGTLLVASAQGPASHMFLGLTAFALAFAAPFFLFALFPQGISRIPRSGPWLSRVKAVLGFLELAASLKFLSNADLYWHWKILTEPVLLAAWASIFLCAVAYLLWPRRIEQERDASSVSHYRVHWGRGVTAAGFALAVSYCFWGLSGRPIALLQTYLPPAGYGGADLAISTSALPWLTNYPKALQLAKTENRPLLIDFTGNFCTNCRYNENNVFPSPSVQSQLSHYVRVQLYTDGQGDTPNQNLEIAKFSSIALPLYGVVNPQTGQPVTKIAGTLTVAQFALFLAQAHGTMVASR